MKIDLETRYNIGDMVRSVSLIRPFEGVVVSIEVRVQSFGVLTRKATPSVAYTVRMERDDDSRARGRFYYRYAGTNSLRLMRRARR